MPPVLQVEFTIEGTTNRDSGTVAAWTPWPDPSDIRYYVMSGYADPIKAAQLIEEALSDGGFVWIIPDTEDGDPGPIQLDGLLFVYGADIHSGRVRDHGPGVDSAPGSDPTPQVPAQVSDSHGDGDGSSSPPTGEATGGDGPPPPPSGGGLIQLAALT